MAKKSSVAKRLSLPTPLEARHGANLRGIAVCRVSDPDKQDERSLPDQEALYRHWLDVHTELPYELTVVAGTGSGESLQREEYFKLTDLVETRQFDFCITEDLGRIVRRIHAHLFCEHCVDHDVRLISINDSVDTAERGWQDRSIIAAWHHERSNRDTSDRIKRTHGSRFHQGGCLPLPIYGYHKKPHAEADDDLEKIPAAEPIYEEWFRRLDGGALYAEIADWLNEQNIAPGRYCRKSVWDGRMNGT
jgi:site-specific DNA recombinase